MEKLTGLPSAFCWSKMGTEAGEDLAQIIARKEFERRANRGLFLWGVGNSVMPAIRDLTKNGEMPRILFSRMKSPPKNSDVWPNSVVLWLRGETPDGRQIPLPKYSFITSRGTSEMDKKRNHYAMFCSSHSSLCINEPLGSLCNDEIVNYRTGRPMGASQVTAVVTHDSICTVCENSRRYQVNLAADLSNPGQVRLTSPVSLDPALPTELSEIVARGKFGEWKRIIAEIKRSAEQSLREESEFTKYALAL